MGLAKRQTAIQHLQALDDLTCPSKLTARHLPVLAPLRPLFGEAGLPMGGVVALQTSTSIGASLALALAAATTAEGSWVVALGWPRLGLVAAHHLGVNLNRLVLAEVNSTKDTLVALDILVGSVELVLVNSLNLNAREVRHLTARLRSKGTTIVSINTSWNVVPEVTLSASVLQWQGLDQGHGHLRQRLVRVWASGRRAAAQHRQVEVWMPSRNGGVETAVVAENSGLRVV